MKSIIFERGQVWYWDDPIYGRKKEKSEPFQIGEASIRYSRYVIIVQTASTIDNQCCLVVPCSTGNHTPHDVPVPLQHLYHGQLSFAKCRTIMPVHPKLLTRYVCKLPDEILNQIDAEIIRLLCPYITNTFSNDDIKEWFNIDMEAEHITKEMVDENGIAFDGWVTAFIEKQLIITGDVRDRVDVSTMKDAFDVFCINTHQAPVYRDNFRFTDTIVKSLAGKGVMSIGNWSTLNYEIAKMTEITGVKLKDYALKVSLSANRNIGKPNKNGTSFSLDAIKNAFNIATKRGKNNWKDEEHIRKFITVYEEDGLMECAAAFNLGQNTAKRYYSKFISAGYTSLPKEAKLPTAKDSPRSVSKVANMIAAYLKDLKTHRVVKNTSMTDDEYYAKIQSACYFGLLEFLGIRVNGSKSYIPTLTAKTEHIETWRFFDIVYHDKKVSTEEDPVRMMNLGHSYYGPTFGISRDWIPMITKRLTRIGLNDQQVAAVITPITDMFTSCPE